MQTRFYVTSREFRMVLIAVVGLVIGAMTFVWSNIRFVGLAYEHQTLSKKHQDLLREN